MDAQQAGCNLIVRVLVGLVDNAAVCVCVCCCKQSKHVTETVVLLQTGFRHGVLLLRFMTMRLAQVVCLHLCVEHAATLCLYLHTQSCWLFNSCEEYRSIHMRMNTSSTAAIRDLQSAMQFPQSRSVPPR